MNKKALLLVSCLVVACVPSQAMERPEHKEESEKIASPSLLSSAETIFRFMLSPAKITHDNNGNPTSGVRSLHKTIAVTVVVGALAVGCYACKKLMQ